MVTATVLKALQALESAPEAVTPVKHGFLWKQSGGFLKTWVRRWYSFEHGSLVYCQNPQDGKEDAKPALTGKILAARAGEGSTSRKGQTLFPLVVTCSEGEPLMAFAEDELTRDQWVHALNDVVKVEKGGQRMVLADRYQVDYSSVLGSGLFAMVLKAKDMRTGEPVAIKVIKPDALRDYGPLIEREAAVWSAVGGQPNVVQLRDVLCSKTRMYFVSELLQGGSLLGGLARNSAYCERDAATVMRQVLEGLHHIHSRGAVHCDLKPENICLAGKAKDSPIKLIDFSLASFAHSPMAPGGTAEFVAPELLTKADYHSTKGCGPEVDMWSAGVLLYYLLSGKTPFFGRTHEDIVAKVKAGSWAFKGSCWTNVSEEARGLVRLLLQVDPKLRLSAREALNHPWLKGPHLPPTAPLEAAMIQFKAQWEESSEFKSAAPHQSSATAPTVGIKAVAAPNQSATAPTVGIKAVAAPNQSATAAAVGTKTSTAPRKSHPATSPSGSSGSLDLRDIQLPQQHQQQQLQRQLEAGIQAGAAAAGARPPGVPRHPAATQDRSSDSRVPQGQQQQQQQAMSLQAGFGLVPGVFSPASESSRLLQQQQQQEEDAGQRLISLRRSSSLQHVRWPADQQQLQLMPLGMEAAIMPLPQQQQQQQQQWSTASSSRNSGSLVPLAQELLPQQQQVQWSTASSSRNSGSLLPLAQEQQQHHLGLHRASSMHLPQDLPQQQQQHEHASILAMWPSITVPQQAQVQQAAIWQQQVAGRYLQQQQQQAAGSYQQQLLPGTAAMRQAASMPQVPHGESSFAKASSGPFHGSASSGELSGSLAAYPKMGYATAMQQPQQQQQQQQPGGRALRHSISMPHRQQQQQAQLQQQQQQQQQVYASSRRRTSNTLLTEVPHMYSSGNVQYSPVHSSGLHRRYTPMNI